MNPPQPPPYQPYGSNEHLPPPANQPTPQEYGQPGAPAYAPVPPPYQPIYTPAPGWNGFAIASLIFGICGGLLFSTIFGIVALVQIKRRGGRGKGMAIAGLVLTGLWIAMIAVGGVAAYLDSAKRDSSGRVTDPGTIQLTSLKTGDCINMTGLKEGTEVSEVPAVPCGQAHDAEVYATFKLTGTSFPGDTEAARLAEEGCDSRLTTFLPSEAARDKLEIYYLHPVKSGWARGDHSVTCLATSTTGKLTGPIKG